MAEELAPIERDLGRLVQVVRDLVDDEPCRLDHHGYCQTHGCLSPGECAVARGRRLLGLEPLPTAGEECGVIMRPRTVGNPTPDPARCNNTRPCSRPGHEDSRADAYGRRAEPR